MNDNKENENYMFKAFFNYYIKKIYHNIAAITDVRLNDIEKYKCLYNDLYANLFKLSIRTLIRQLHLYKDSGFLEGITKEERFEDFEQRTKEKDFKLKLFSTYPELEQIINDYVISISNYIGTIIKDLDSDSQKIQEFFDIQVNKIVDISIGKGDTHNGGKSVAIIYFENHQIVYKPHSLTADNIFLQILNWINENKFLPYNLTSVKTVSFQNRGWQEFVKHLPCDNQNEVNEYYYKAGCFLAIFQAIGTTDLHFENVIASKNNPMFIDMETIFTNNRIEKINTVLNTGLLPQVTTDFLIDVDICGISGKSTKSQKMKMIMIKNRRTDEMLVDEVPAVIENRQNLVFYNNRAIEADNYADVLISGYQTVLDFLINNSEEFITLLDNYINDGEMFRTVLRHTQVYSKYLSVALHPDYLADSNKRKVLFQRLRDNCKNIQEYPRVDDEIATLINGDVPYYMFDYRSKNLYSNNGLVSEQYFLQSAREIIMVSISNLKKYRDANIRLIRKSLYTAYPPKDSNIVYCGNDKERPTNSEMVLKFAKEITENIFYISDHQACIYFINCLYNNKISLESINADIYEGGGIILYLAAVGKLYENTQYLVAAEKLLDTVTEVIRYKSSDIKYSISISAYFGYGSLIYLNYILFYMTDDARFKDAAERAFHSFNDNSLFSNIEQNKAYDYLGGIAGVIVFMAHIIQKQENKEMRCMCLKMGEMLENYINRAEISTVGLAHGLSGFAYAFVMLFKITNKTHFLEVAKKLLLKEDDLYLKDRPEKVSWCKGETGMCLARLKYLELNMCPEIKKKFTVYYEILITKGLHYMNNMCLCHGIYGNIEVIEKINQTELVSDDKKISSNELVHFKNSLSHDPKEIYLGFHKEFSTEIFMTGLSGIFYSIMREEYKNLPSILFLEI